MEPQTKLRRGDLSPCGSLRFWGYQTHVKKDGTRSERWLSATHFDRYRKQVDQGKELCSARTQFHREKRMTPKTDPREYVWKIYGIK